MVKRCCRTLRLHAGIVKSSHAIQMHLMVTAVSSLVDLNQRVAYNLPGTSYGTFKRRVRRRNGLINIYKPLERRFQ